MKQIDAAVLILATAVLLAACGGSKSVRQPAVLERVEDVQVRIVRDWRSSNGPDTGSLEVGLAAALHDDALFTATVDGNVYALDNNNGSVIWRSNVGARLAGGPTVDGVNVIVGGRKGEVIALSRSDGEPRWRTQVSSEVVTAPASNGDVVIVRSVDGRTTALDADTGDQRWIAARSVPPLTLRGMAPPRIVGDLVIVGLETGRLVALRLDNGEPAWDQVVTVPSGRSELERIADVDAPLVIDGDTLYVMSYGGEIAAIGVNSGDVRWRRAIRSYSGGAVSLDGDRLYVTDDAGAVWALQTENGAAAWKSEALAYRGLSAPVVHEDFVVVSDFEGYVHYLSTQDGDIQGRERMLRNRVTATPLVGNGRLYLADIDGRIVALRAERTQ